ncbi:MAG TPA: DUF4434 domain-containing protein [Thermotogota bacterium]|nr:DUF4434 domain-containing protein [Thermotogota bacterium]
MKDYKIISGTFLDEITYDIPAHNWGAAEWETEFQTFKCVGIDTVIIIRAGLGNKCIFNSRVIDSYTKTMNPYIDHAKMFLELSEKYGLKLYFGLYDSGYHWLKNDWKKEFEINSAFIEEVAEKYSGYQAFKGWYLPHETGDTGNRIITLNTNLAQKIKEISDLPILVSPFIYGRENPYDGVVYGRSGMSTRSVDEHLRQWDEIFAAYSGLIDFAAFQDGTSDFMELKEYTSGLKSLADKYGIALWSNVESFDRDMPIKFPPIEWRKLLYKMDVVQPYVEKLITFEFSHFMSPNSVWGSARNLFKRYEEHIGNQ